MFVSFFSFGPSASCLLPLEAPAQQKVVSVNLKAIGNQEVRCSQTINVNEDCIDIRITSLNQALQNIARHLGSQPYRYNKIQFNTEMHMYNVCKAEVCE